MQKLKVIFEPLRIINYRTMSLVIIIESLFALSLWQLNGGGLIPTPTKIGAAIVQIIGSRDFWDNFFSSLALTLKGMSISIVMALLVSYLSLIPFFKPVARFIIKCRYLTLTGLIFLFTLLTKDGHDLKISLLLFGIIPFFVTSFLSIIDSINVQE